MKVSKCWKPDELHPHLIGVDERTTRAVMIKTNSPDLIDIIKRKRYKLDRDQIISKKKKTRESVKQRK